MRYKADITAGALKLPESRIIADLLLAEVDAAGLEGRHREAERPPGPQPRHGDPTDEADPRPAGDDGAGPVEAGPGRQGQRGHPCGPRRRRQAQSTARRLPRSGRRASSTGCSAKTLTNKLWDDYLDGCRERDPDMPQWNESTRRRLRSSVFQTLAQAGYIENTRSLKLQTVHIADQVLHYLKAHDEEYVLRCIQVAP